MQFGEQLREWRSHRRMSQLGLATEAGISARHLSFLETGRSRPTPGMILRLSSVLGIPTREQGSLFAAAGFRPRYHVAAVTLADLPDAVSHAIGLILGRHDPYPGIVFDHEYNLLTTNAPFAELAAGAGIALQPGDNFLDFYMCHQMARSVVGNWERTAADLLHRVRSEAWLQGPHAPLSARLARLLQRPDVAALLSSFPDSEKLPVLPIEMRLNGIELSFITTLTTFGSAHDALAQSLVIESFFPADETTRAFFERKQA